MWDQLLSMKDKKAQEHDRRRLTMHFIPLLPQLLAKVRSRLLILYRYISYIVHSVLHETVAQYCLHHMSIYKYTLECKGIYGTALCNKDRKDGNNECMSSVSFTFSRIII